MSHVISRRKVAEIVGEGAAMLVSQVDHAEMNHGEHWLWHGEQVFTAAGVALLVERLQPEHKAEALALSAEAKRVFAAAAPAPAVAPIGRQRAEHNPLNGYQPEPQEFLA